MFKGNQGGPTEAGLNIGRRIDNYLNYKYIHNNHIYVYSNLDISLVLFRYLYKLQIEQEDNLY